MPVNLGDELTTAARDRLIAPLALCCHRLDRPDAWGDPPGDDPRIGTDRGATEPVREAEGPGPEADDEGTEPDPEPDAAAEADPEEAGPEPEDGSPPDLDEGTEDPVGQPTSCNGTLLAGLEALRTVRGGLQITKNDVLTSLRAQDGLASLGDRIEIARNPRLPTCEVTRLVERLRALGWEGEARIEDTDDAGTCEP